MLVMEIKKNIILISGTDRIGALHELERFTKAFRDRQSDMNIESFAFDEIIDWNTVRQKILSVGLFVEKRLFIFRWNFEEKAEKGEKKTKAKVQEDGKDTLLSILESIDTETFIILFPDGIISWWLSTWIAKNADIRKFEGVFSLETWAKRFPNIERSTVSEVVKKHEKLYALYEEYKKPRNISLFISESLEKIDLIRLSETLTEEHIESSITLWWTWRMYDLADAVLEWNSQKSLTLFRAILSEINVYQFLPSFIWLIRSSVYVRFLKEKKMSERDITSLLKLHPFVVKKSFHSRVSWPVLREFFDKIVTTNIAYRSWKWLHDAELWRIFSIEQVLMGLKK